MAIADDILNLIIKGAKPGAKAGKGAAKGQLTAADRVNLGFPGHNGGPPLYTPFEKRGSEIAARLAETPTAAGIARGVEAPPGAGYTSVKSLKPLALPEHYSAGLLDEMVQTPVQKNIEDFEGRTLMGIVGDQSGRHIVTDMNGIPIEPTNTQGGFQYIDVPGQGYAGAQSATSGKLAEAARTEDPLYFSVMMGDQSSDFAVPQALLYGSLVDNTRLTRDQAAKANEIIRNISMSVKREVTQPDGTKKMVGETVRPFTGFKDVSAPGYLREYILSLPSGTQRAAFAKGLDTATLVKLGLPRMSDARLAMADPALIGMDWGSTGYRAFVPDLQRGMYKTTPEQSLTYDFGVDKVGPSYSLTGEGRGIPYALAFPDVASELRAKGTGGGLEMTSAAYKVFEGSHKRAKQLVNSEVIDLVGSFRDIEKRSGRETALRFANDVLKDVNVTPQMVEAARRANAPAWLIAAMAPALGLLDMEAAPPDEY
jgi:hypothetical protein